MRKTRNVVNDEYIKVFREMVAFCDEYEQENHKCVSFYMLATHAYMNELVSWVASLRSRKQSQMIALYLSDRRADRHHYYGVRKEEARDTYYRAKEQYEHNEMVQWEEECHREHEAELCSREDRV